MSFKLLADATNVVLQGPNGVDKTTLARNLAHQALLHGHTVLFTSAGAPQRLPAAPQRDSYRLKEAKERTAQDRAMKRPWQQRPPFQPPTIPLSIPAADWIPEQALAVVELLDELRERIAADYALDLTEALRQLQGAGDPDQGLDGIADDEPF